VSTNVCVRERTLDIYIEWHWPVSKVKDGEREMLYVQVYFFIICYSYSVIGIEFFSISVVVDRPKNDGFWMQGKDTSP